MWWFSRCMMPLPTTDDRRKQLSRFIVISRLNSDYNYNSEIIMPKTSRSTSSKDNNNDLNITRLLKIRDEFYQRYAITMMKEKQHQPSDLEKYIKLMEVMGHQEQTVGQLHNAVLNYAKANLNKVGTGQHYTNEEVNIARTRDVSKSRTDTKSERVAAVNLLLEIISTSSAKEIYDYITTPAFKKLAGLLEIKVNVFRRHLATDIQEFMDSYTAYLSITTDKVLIDALTDLSVVESMKDDDWINFLIHYNPRLVADLLLSIYQDKPINLVIRNLTITREFLQQILNEDYAACVQLNKLRAQAKSTLILPQGSLVAGKNTLREEQLTINQLYQYEDTTIAAIENWLYQNYAPIIANQILDRNQQRPALDEYTPYQFYMIPTAEYMLVNPDDHEKMKSEGELARYDRYVKYRQDVRSLIASAANHLVPIVFCGVMNIESVHYVAVFFHRAQNGLITVICVDPSPRMYPEGSPHYADDPKLKSDRKLQRIYQDVFAGFDQGKLRFISIDAAQMLRERDCGPNSATTVLLALKTCLTDKPLLTIAENGELRFDESQLSESAKPVGINQYTGHLVYSHKLDDESLANRDEWEKRILPFQQVYPYTVRRSGATDKPSIRDEFLLSDQLQIDFNYREEVQKQQSQDMREANLSVVRSLLLSTEEGNNIIRELELAYREDLNLPSTTPLEEFLKGKYQAAELTSLTQAHQGSLTLLCQNVILVILKDAVPKAFINVFENTALLKLPQTTALSAEAIVDEFIRRYHEIFAQLTIYQQSQIRTTMMQLASVAVVQHLKQLHWNIVYPYMKDNMQRVLDELQASDETQLSNALIAQLSKATCEINENIQFLNVHDGVKLSQWLWFEVTRALNVLIAASVKYVTADFATEFATLNDILRLFATQTNTFIPMTISELSGRLPKSTPGIVGSEKLATTQGMMLLDAVNKERFNLATARLNQLAQYAVEAFISVDGVKGELSRNQDYVTLTEHVYQDTGIALDPACIPNLEEMIARFGSKETLTGEDYHHTLSGRYLHDNLTLKIRQFYLEILSAQYTSISKIILSWCPQKTYAEFKMAAIPADEFFQYLMLRSAYYPASHKLFADFPVLFYRQSPNVYNHFVKWFHDTMQFVLWNHFAEFDVLYQRAEWMREALLQLKSDLSANQFQEQANKFEQYLTDLITQIQTISSIDVINIKQGQYQEALRRFNETYQGVVKLLLSSPYVVGEIKPMSFTAIVRPVLCRLFGLEVNAVITVRDAAILDERIQKAAANLQANELPPIAEDPSSLLSLPLTLSLTDTYAKPLTRDIILNCIAYWQSHFSWQYKLKHTQIWMSVDKEPAFIKMLMRFITDNLFDDDGVLTADGSQRLHDALLNRKSRALQLSIYAAGDIDSQIKAALLRTSTLSNTKVSKIQFRQLAKLFNLPVSLQQRKVVVASETDIQKRLLLLMRQHREADLNYVPNIPALRAQAVRDLQGGISQSSAALDVFSYPAAELSRRKGLFGTQLFSGMMNHAEKVLLQIREKHAPSDDFALDEDDLNMLSELMRDRWKKLYDMHNGDQELAYLHYANPRDRSDKVYVALAEMVARNYRAEGAAVYMHTLLMPNYIRFAGAANLVSHKLPQEMVIELGGDNADESNLDDIPLSQLIITRNGYPLNMLAILQNYQTKFTFMNPHTSKFFSQVEIDAICAHPRANELVDLIKINTIPRLTERALDLLVDYLNGAIFTSGFTDYYSRREDNQAFDYYIIFSKKLLTLPANEREGLLNEPIPGEGDATVASTLKISEVSGLDAEGRCLTLRGVSLARVVIAYKGSNHGLTNSTLVHRAMEKKIPRKVYPNMVIGENRGELGEVERAILDTFERQQLLSAHKRSLK